MAPNAEAASPEITAGLSHVLRTLKDPAGLDAIIQADLQRASQFEATPEFFYVITTFCLLGCYQQYLPRRENELINVLKTLKYRRRA